MDKEEILAKQWHRIYQLSYNSQGNKFVEAEAIRNRLFLLDHHKPHTGALVCFCHGIWIFWQFYVLPITHVKRWYFDALKASN